jgi:hypothetical protein
LDQHAGGLRLTGERQCDRNNNPANQQVNGGDVKREREIVKDLEKPHWSGQGNGINQRKLVHMAQGSTQRHEKSRICAGPKPCRCSSTAEVTNGFGIFRFTGGLLPIFCPRRNHILPGVSEPLSRVVAQGRRHLRRPVSAAEGNGGTQALGKLDAGRAISQVLVDCLTSVWRQLEIEIFGKQGEYFFAPG